MIETFPILQCFIDFDMLGGLLSQAGGGGGFGGGGGEGKVRGLM